MKTIQLNTDYFLPIMGLGTWKSKAGEVYQAIRWAIKLGYRHIDCAAVYGNEKEIGQALHDAVAEGDIKREELFVTSKLWNDAHAPQDVLPALEQTLKDLQLEYLDAYLMHWPVAQKKGVIFPEHDDDMVSLADIPLELTWGEMEKAQKKDLIRSLGVSNFGCKNIRTLLDKAEIMPAINQIESHPLLPQTDLIDCCKKNQIAVVAYSPLGSHDSQDASAPNLLEDATIKDIAERSNATPAQILLSWQMQRDVAVIPKTVHQERLKENFAAQAIELDAADMEEISKLENGHRFIDGSTFFHGGYDAQTIFD